MPIIRDRIAQLGPWPCAKDTFTQQECDIWNKSYSEIVKSIPGQSYVNAGKAVDEVENKLRHARFEQHKTSQVVEELEKALEIAKHVEATLGAVEVP
jgi:hypothetical protein